jgi:16S rRNA pseudouridine516 synthase
MRLDKYIASVSNYSRSQVKQAVKTKDVSVNGVKATTASIKVNETDDVTIYGNAMREAGPRYIMLHKPKGYVSANKDANSPTALDLIDEDNLEKLHIAGRLDVDSTGLLLLTDDGKWTHRVISPNRDCVKRYKVTLEHPIEDDYAERLAGGMLLTGEPKPCKPATLEVIDAHTAWLSISEGKFHQIKRMFIQLNNLVTDLHRESIGDIMLDQNLAPGEYRFLSPQEIESV